MSLQSLPLELISLIVEEFQSDKKSLKNISLVSRPFLHACRTHLFTVLRINSLQPAFDYKCKAWYDLIRRSPALLPYIRVLELGPPIFRVSKDTAVWSSQWGDIMRRGVPSIHDEKLEFIMAGATNVKKVILRLEYQPWQNFSPAFRRTVLDLIQRESVTSLSIEDVIGFPLETLRNCRGLKDLSLISITASEQPSEEARADHQRQTGRVGHLESFTAIASDQCIGPLIDTLSSPKSSLDISCLQRLAVNITGTDGRTALSRFPICSQTITTLDLRLNSSKEYDVCDLQKFPNLRSLFISAAYTPFYRPILPLARLLARGGKSSNLQELKIFFRQESPDFEDFEPESPSQALTRICMSRDWKEFEQKLTKQALFPSLRKMSLVFRPKDMTIFLNDYLTMSLHLCLVKAMPALYALTNPTIEVYDDRFEQYIPNIFETKNRLY